MGTVPRGFGCSFFSSGLTAVSPPRVEGAGGVSGCLAACLTPWTYVVTVGTWCIPHNEKRPLSRASIGSQAGKPLSPFANENDSLQ